LKYKQTSFEAEKITDEEMSTSSDLFVDLQQKMLFELSAATGSKSTQIESKSATQQKILPELRKKLKLDNINFKRTNK
jgi:hypothetical protein